MEPIERRLLILIGRPGCGKDTQSNNLKEKGYTVITASNLLITPECENYKKKGELIPDSIVIQTIVDELDRVVKTNGKVVLNGAPRTKTQAQSLIHFAKKHFEKITTLLIDIDEKEAKIRLSRRGRCDDDRNTVENRMRLYNGDTLGAKIYLFDHTEAYIVDGLGDKNNVWAKINDFLQKDMQIRYDHSDLIITV